MQWKARSVFAAFLQNEVTFCFLSVDLFVVCAAGGCMRSGVGSVSGV